MKASRQQTEHLLNSEESNSPALVLKQANVGIILSIRMLRTTLHVAFNASYFSHSDICITSVVWLPMQLPALRFYQQIGCGRVAEQAGYITSSTRSEGISVPTWLRSGLKFRVQTVPHCSVRNWSQPIFHSGLPAGAADRVALGNKLFPEASPAPFGIGFPKPPGETPILMGKWPRKQY